MARMMMVTRPFSGRDGEIRPGTVVDAEGWRNAAKLEDQGRMRPATDDEIKAAGAKATAAKKTDPPKSDPPKDDADKGSKTKKDAAPKPAAGARGTGARSSRPRA